MADLLGLAARYVDEDVWEGPGAVNRITSELSELADGVAMARESAERNGGGPQSTS